jgi:xanthine/uracil/vitamin C permease (AzgA family)
VNPACRSRTRDDVGGPTTFLTMAIAFGFIVRPVLKLAAARAREASPVAYALAVLFVLRYALL